MSNVILASASAVRGAMLAHCGVQFHVEPARIDEDAAKVALRSGGLSPRDLADALAELKALNISRKHPDALVIGCDQTLAFDDDTMLDKPGEDLGDNMRRLSGRTHRLFSAAVVAEGGQPVWRHVETVTLTVRLLSDAFIESYVAAADSGLKACLGGYRIEGSGARLFSEIRGSHFAIMGLPLLPLLNWLHLRGAIVS